MFYALLAAVPLVVLTALLVIWLWPAPRAMAVGLGLTVLVAVTAWDVPANWLMAAGLSGLITTAEILWIVFGALLLLYCMTNAGAVDRINQGFADISPDRRVQVILLGFFLGAFLEGVAGFGTPAAVVGPLLLGMGFPPLAAGVVALLGHSVAPIFGAVGTAVVVGVRAPLNSLAGSIQEIGYSVQEFTHLASLWGAGFQLIVVVLLPVMLVYLMVHSFGTENDDPIQALVEVLPLCLVSSLAFGVPFVLTAYLLGPELPSIIGAALGGAVIVGLLKQDWLTPDNTWTFPDRSAWADHWVGSVTSSEDDQSGNSSMSLLKAWFPYGLLVLLLVATRMVPTVKSILQTTPLALEWTALLGTDLSGQLRWAYVPGTWLVLAALGAAWVYGLRPNQIKESTTEALGKLAGPAVALVCVVPMVVIMLESGSHSGAPEVGSMMEVLAASTAQLTGEAYTLLTAAVGAAGTFVVGSITVSNLTFTGFQFEVATQLGIRPEQLVGLQMVGASIANALAVHNVIAALATIGLSGEEGRVIRLNAIPVLVILIMLGVCSWLVTML